MARFLLIHGSCHGAWCWRDVLPVLHDAGHQATAIDLPGHGACATPLAQITLDLYADAIVAAMPGPTILVGHSMAGYPITAAAERAPENIVKLIYVCAYVPQSGLSLADMRRQGPSQPLLEAIETAPDRASFTFRPDMAQAKFYHDCPPGTLEYALPRLTPQAIKPQATALMLTPRSQAIPKRYIRCMDDRAIPPAYQVTMSQGWADTADLPCSHSPFFAMPQALARLLMAQ
ncbi:MAG: alpha/beta fold hydrolase [Paracoccaceae bacterium]|nr:alpha/beta fold hydrolase [Paracoccaceae bacterium]